MLLLKPLIQKGGNSLTFLVATLGTYIVLQNIISLIFGDSSKVIRIGEVKQGIELFNGFITQIQVFSVIIIILIITSLYAVFMQTNFGKQLRCVSSNNNLSNIFGIDSLKVIKFSFLIGALLAGIVGILIGLDITLTPSMGFDYLLYGIICMIIGGTGSVRGAIPAAIIVSSSQHIGAFIFNYVWMEAIAYAILILFLLFRPLGFSGKQLKKVEI
jgi:branched-chain amino acid transport system permease protein